MNLEGLPLCPALHLHSAKDELLSPAVVEFLGHVVHEEELLGLDLYFPFEHAMQNDAPVGK